MSIKTWKNLVTKAVVVCDQKKYGHKYIDRLKFELKEIDKQGANNYWMRLYDSGQKFEHNNNGLVLPFLLGLTDVDPIEQEIEHVIQFDPEFPDIDVDLLPEARDHIKKYAEETYGQEHVCNVGLWLTYKAKLALQDSATVLGHNRHEVIAILKDLPEEFDEMPYEQAYEEFEGFRKLSDDKPEIIELAYKMMGKIKSQGKHAGGLIISDVPVRDYIPLTYIGKDGNKQWTSAWTEGMAASQLSKFGFVKFDLLGLLNISYIYNCKKLIKINRGDDIDFDDMDPKDDRAGIINFSDGTRKKILFNDPEAIKKADKIKLESIFQFDTDFAKSIVEKGGVRSFTDLLIYTSLGRPGPLPMIDVYIKNRDDPDEGWKRKLHPQMSEILGETKGVLCIDSETLIRTGTGNDRYIKELKPGDMVMSYCSKTRKIEPQPIVKIGQTKVGDGLTITTDDNRTITTTSDHEFICFDGSLKKANELVIDDLIPVPVSHDWNWKQEPLEVFGFNGNNGDWAYLFGYLVGDGLLTQTSPTICCGNIKKHADGLNIWLQHTFKFETSIYWHCRSWYIRITDSNPIRVEPEIKLKTYSNTHEWWQKAYNCLPASVIASQLNKSSWWVYNKLYQHKIDLKNKRRIVSRNRLSLIVEQNDLNHNVYNKRIPNWIFNSDVKSAQKFLAGLLDADGCVTQQGRVKLISFVSCNSALLNDVSKLLDILSIDHNFQKDRIFVWGQEVFKNTILPYSLKRDLWNNKLPSCTGKNLGWVSRSVVLDKAKECNLPQRHLDRQNILYRGHWKNGAPKFCKSSTARKVGIELGQVRFQKIKSIEKTSDRVYYGIEVANNHTLIGNGIIVHNCFQEQLLRIWVEVCGFTMPEAEAAQKAVKKKKVEVLNEIEPRVIEGATPILGASEAQDLWDKMVSFGRYCFNKCLSEDEILTNPETNERIAIKKLYDNNKSFKLLSYNGHEAFIDDVVNIHYNGKQEVFRIEFSNGAKQDVTIGHQFLNEFGEMEEVSSILKTGNAIKYVGSTTDNIKESELKEEANGRCHIVSLKSLGVKNTYSPEMKSKHHNYITDPECGIVHKNSHAVAYMIIAYRCLWLKTHYPAEWWAAVLSECPNYRVVQYMGAARSEGIEFGSINVNSLTTGFSVDGDKITPGVLSVKGVGKSVAAILVEESKNGIYKDLDDFISRIGRNKIATERLIKLGGFETFHKNRRALWMWYLYQYDTTVEARKIRLLINSCYLWPTRAVEDERKRQIVEYKRLYPKRKKIPKKILSWVPSQPYSTIQPYDPNRILTDEETKMAKALKLEFDLVINLFPRDYTLEELLGFEKEYLGYYWHSPLDMFVHGENTTIEHAKVTGILECVIEESFVRQGARGDYMILNATDGINSTRINVWGNEMLCNDETVFDDGTGVRMSVSWQEKWRSFAVKRSTIIMPLPLKEV